MAQATISRFRHLISTLNDVVSTHAPSCGASYFSARTMHEIERIKALRKSAAVNRTVPVAAFEAVDA